MVVDSQSPVPTNETEEPQCLESEKKWSVRDAQVLRSGKSTTIHNYTPDSTRKEELC